MGMGPPRARASPRRHQVRHRRCDAQIRASLFGVYYTPPEFTDLLVRETVDATIELASRP